MKDYYYILGVKENSSATEIKKAYRKLSLKFHPDKNDGDEFFTEHFKSIQEAYEILNDDAKRQAYDLKRGGYKPNESEKKYSYQQEVAPTIEYFETSKSYFFYGDEITFSWKTVNADIVTLKPFGQVDLVGQKTYRIKDLKNEVLTFILIAESSSNNKKTQQKIVLDNYSYKSEETQDEFTSSNQTETSSTKEQEKTVSNFDEEKYNRHNRLITIVVLTTLGLLLLFRVGQQIFK